jgi:hypothetical protein
MERGGVVLTTSQRTPGVHGAVLAVAITSLSMAGCGPRHDVKHGTWTLFDIQSALHAGQNVAMGPTFPDGIPASAFLTMGQGFDTLNVVPMFSDGEPAATVTTDIWVNYDEVWLQPGFVQATDLSRADPLLRNPDQSPAPLLLDVGPKSTFYSPFWQLSYAVVGDVDPNLYRSTRDIRDAHLETEPIEPRLSPLRPLDVPVLGAAPGAHPTEPTWNTALPDIPAGEAWINGQKFGQLDFGPRIFDYEAYEDQGTIVEPFPLFLFYAADATGALVPLPNAYRVGGVGELFSGATADEDEAAADATGFSQPHFGGFWRFHQAIVPPGAAAFTAGALPGPAPAGVDLKLYQGRVALDAACFARSDFPAGCDWLDSQAKIEATLGTMGIVPTEVLSTCPFVYYDGKPVTR